MWLLTNTFHQLLIDDVKSLYQLIHCSPARLGYLAFTQATRVQIPAMENSVQFFLAKKKAKNCKTLKPQKGFLEIKKRRRKKHRVKERDEWCRSTRFLLQRSSTPWLCCSLCLQGTTFLSLSFLKFSVPFY